MLARKISASSGASAGRNGRSAGFGFARAVIAPPPRRPRPPHPQGERVSECAAPSSLHLPGRAAVLVILEFDAHRLELIADAIGLLEVFFSARGIARIDQRINATGISNHLIIQLR